MAKKNAFLCNTTIDFKAYWVCASRPEKVEGLGVYSLFHKIKKKISVLIRGLQVWVTIEIYDNSFRIIILRRLERVVIAVVLYIITDRYTKYTPTKSSYLVCLGL